MIQCSSIVQPSVTIPCHKNAVIVGAPVLPCEPEVRIEQGKKCKTPQK